MTDEEVKSAFNSGWYAMVAIRSQVILNGFNIYNQLKLADADHAFVLPQNLGAWSLTI